MKKSKEKNKFDYTAFRQEAIVRLRGGRQRVDYDFLTIYFLKPTTV